MAGATMYMMPRKRKKEAKENEPAGQAETKSAQRLYEEFLARYDSDCSRLGFFPDGRNPTLIVRELKASFPEDFRTFLARALLKCREKNISSDKKHYQAMEFLKKAAEKISPGEEQEFTAYKKAEEIVEKATDIFLCHY